MNFIVRWISAVIRFFDFITPLSDLILRLYVAEVFWAAGLAKIENFQSTLLLFQHEYQVPCLPPEVAAYLGTCVELSFPVFLAMGLFGRFSAGVLFFYNIMAVISYPALQDHGLQWHIVWGIMLLVLLCRGPGKLSFDHFLWKNIRQVSPNP